MKDDTITIRLNKEERQQLERIKLIMNLKGTFGEDSKAIKGSMNFTENVAHRLFGGNIGGLFVSKKEKKSPKSPANVCEFC